MKKKKILTLCFVLQDDKILLGMKKRGFGAGRWNGFGGKIEEGESIEEAATREMREECGIAIQQMEKVGIHEFVFQSNPSEVLEVHVFRVDAFSGEPVETEEMRPQWFTIDALPYDEMWPDDIHWMPVFLVGKKFRTKFLFGGGDVILENEVLEVENLDESNQIA
jgi:8-oxo-dGTP diphosphatase/2-hydroxy-dATP diphosphatase